MSSLFGDVRQLGFMSRDIDRSMRYFVDSWGVGPWSIIRKITSEMLYKGAKTQVDISIAMANCGDLQFEIVAQHNAAPSLYLDSLAQTPALHVQHVAVWTHDVAGIEANAHVKGWQSVFETMSGPGRSVFVTHPDEPMVCIEISDCDPFKVRVRESIKQISLTWDGGDPVREGLPEG